MPSKKKVKKSKPKSRSKAKQKVKPRSKKNKLKIGGKKLDHSSVVAKGVTDSIKNVYFGGGAKQVK